MKKLMTLLILILTLTISIPSLPVVAMSTEPETTTTAVDRATRQAQRQEILDLRVQVLANRTAILEQVSENRTSRQELKALIEANRATIPASTVEELKELHAQVIALAENIRATQGEIADIRTQLRTLNPRTDFEAIKAATQAIIAIQNQRLTDLQAIHDLLQQMLALNFTPIVIN